MRLEEQNLKKYYKNIIVCKKCRRKYGSDLKKENGFCPLCDKRKTKYGLLRKKYGINR